MLCWKALNLAAESYQIPLQDGHCPLYNQYTRYFMSKARNRHEYLCD